MSRARAKVAVKPATPPALTIVVDSREQLHYDFAGLCPVVRRGLPAGDYSIDGFETSFAIERKSLQDAFGTVIGDRARFVRELERLRSYTFAAILIEGSFQDVLEYTSPASTGITPEQRAARPRTVINSLNSWWIEFGVVPLFVSRDRDLCRTEVYRLAERFWRAKSATASAAVGGAA